MCSIRKSLKHLFKYRRNEDNLLKCIFIFRSIIFFGCKVNFYLYLDCCYFYTS